VPLYLVCGQRPTRVPRVWEPVLQSHWSYTVIPAGWPVCYEAIARASAKCSPGTSWVQFPADATEDEKNAYRAYVVRLRKELGDAR